MLGLGHGPCCLEAWALGVHPLPQLVCDSCDLLWVGFTDWLGGCCAEAWGVMLEGALGSCFKIFQLPLDGFLDMIINLSHDEACPCTSLAYVSIGLASASWLSVSVCWILSAVRRIATWLSDIWNLSLVSMTCQGLVSVSTWCRQGFRFLQLQLRISKCDLWMRLKLHSLKCWILLFVGARMVLPI